MWESGSSASLVMAEASSFFSSVNICSGDENLSFVASMAKVSLPFSAGPVLFVLSGTGMYWGCRHVAGCLPRRNALIRSCICLLMHYISSAWMTIST